MTALEDGRQAFARQAWGRACRLLVEADAASPLAPEDLERAGLAAYLAGRDEDCVGLLERAFQAQVATDDVDGATVVGFWLTYVLAMRGDGARANGWAGRTRAVADAAGPESVAFGYLATGEGCG